MTQKELMIRLERIERLAIRLWSLTERPYKGCTRGLPGWVGPSSDPNDEWTPIHGILGSIEETLCGIEETLSSVSERT